MKNFQVLKSILRSDLNQAALDTFGRRHDYLRISLTEKCSLRCTYCMPENGVTLSPKDHLLSFDEVFRISSIFVQKLGVSKIRLTGGEPMVRKDCLSIIEKLSSLKTFGLQTIGMTTNGLVLNTMSDKLKKAGLDALNISLDTLEPKKFEFITRRNGWQLVMRGITAAIQTNFPHPIKLNVVVMKGLNDDELCDFVQLTELCPVDVRFIEYMPFDGNKWKPQKMMPYKEMLENIRKKFPNISPIKNDLKQNDTSKPYKVPGYLGQIGFITSMSKNFCGSCNRLRITADGHLKICLFGSEEVSLRSLLRDGSTDEQIIQDIRSAVLRKKERHAGASKISLTPNRPMILIGSVRCFSSSGNEFSHLDSKGNLRMVDVSEKRVTDRKATARSTVFLGHHVIQQIKAGSDHLKKGDVVTVSKVAGVQAAKKTSQLIPLCHQIPLSHVHLKIDLDEHSGHAVLECTARATSQTGVEMEALTGVTVASLTLYDMCKSLNRHIEIREVILISKTGGKSDLS